MSLTAYQRGHRDALLAFAGELDSGRQDPVPVARRRAIAMQVVARLRREGFISLDDARMVMASLDDAGPHEPGSRLARQRAESLPHDPEEPP